MYPQSATFSTLAVQIVHSGSSNMVGIASNVAILWDSEKSSVERQDTHWSTETHTPRQNLSSLSPEHQPSPYMPCKSLPKRDLRMLNILYTRCMRGCREARTIPNSCMSEIRSLWKLYRGRFRYVFQWIQQTTTPQTRSVLCNNCG